MVQAALNDELELVASPRLMWEITSVLSRPKFRRWFTLDQAKHFVTALQHHSTLYPDDPMPPARTRDPKDDYLVALAETARALLVSGDSDLLDAGSVPAAVTPRVLLDRLAE